MRSRLLALVGAIVVAACSTKTDAPADTGMAAQGVSAAPGDRTAVAATIAAADSAWMRHVQSKNVDSVMTWYTSDAVSYGFGAPASGTDKIRANYTEFVKATIADPKILSNTVNVSDDGKYLIVWRKSDGKWKTVSESNSMDKAPAQ